MVLDNRRGQASYGETRCALSICADAGAHLLFPFSDKPFLHAEAAEC
jgi:hypothetical protein